MSENSTICIIKKDGTKIENLPILVTETLFTRSALKHTEKLFESIIESDSPVTSQAITEEPILRHIYVT